jgi:hypothetical protein
VSSLTGLDILLYGEQFAGMKLAGIIFISSGFILVFTPNDWYSAVRNIVRWVGQDKTSPYCGIRQCAHLSSVEVRLFSNQHGPPNISVYRGSPYHLTPRGPDSKAAAAVIPSEGKTRVEAYWEDNVS